MKWLIDWFRRRHDHRAMKRQWKAEARQLAKEREHRRKVAELRGEIASQEARAKGLLRIGRDQWQPPWEQRDALKAAAEAEAKAARARVLLHHYAEELP